MKFKLKIFAILLSLILLALPLASCVKNRGKPVMTLEGTVLNDQKYKYHLCTYKAMLLSHYSDAADTDEFWDRTISNATGETAEDYFNDLIQDYIKTDVVTMYLFDKYGLSVSDEDRSEAEKKLEEIQEDFASGNKDELNRQLSPYGVDADLLLEIFTDSMKSIHVYNHVFENSILSVGDAEKQAFLEENYVRIIQIYINNKYDPEKSSYDADGRFRMAPLDDEAKAEKDEVASRAGAALDAGADFYDVYEEFSEDKEYPNGYYLSVSTQGLPKELLTNALTLEVGETATFESDYGIHIIKRIEMDSGAYDVEENSDFFTDFKELVYEDVFDKFIHSFYDRIATTEEIKKYSVRDAEPNYYYVYY